MPKIITASLAVAALVAAGSANAASPATTTFAVTATVLKTCSVSAGPVAFGNYTPGIAVPQVNSQISVKCTKSTPFTVSLDKGANGTIAQRLMSNGTDTLQYNLYTTTAATTIFGDGATGVTQAGTGVGLASAVLVQVYGNLPDNAANQAASPGSYADTINVSVAY
jgi:spore coat protein U-like protein